MYIQVKGLQNARGCQNASGCISSHKKSVTHKNSVMLLFFDQGLLYVNKVLF